MAYSVEWMSEGLRFSSSDNGTEWLVVPTGGFVHAAGLIGGPADARRAWALTGLRNAGGEQRILVLFDLSRHQVIATHEFQNLDRALPLPSRDARRLYVAGSGTEGEPYKPGWRTWPELFVIHAETGRIENHLRLDPNFRLYGQRPAETVDGRVRVPALVVSAQPGQADTAIVTVDPKTGASGVAGLCGYRNHCWLSPKGSLALTPDFTRLPFRDELAGPLRAVGLGSRKRYYGLPMQLWDAEAASFIRSLTVAWFGEDELPIEAQMRGKSRGETYERLRALCDILPAGSVEGPTETVGPFSEDRELELLRNLHRAFADQLADSVYWAEDEQQFWVRSHGFVSCVRIDGTASPRLRFERTGMKAGMIVPFAEGPGEVHPLGNDKSRFLFGPSAHLIRRIEAEAVVTAPFPPTFAPVQVISRSSDGWRDTRSPSFEKRVRELVEQLRAATVRLRDLSEAQCIRAINSLVKDLPRHLENKTHNTLDLFFELPDRTLDEEQFFAHVEAAVPEAVPSLRKLLDRILKLCSDLPYASNDRQLLAPAAQALGVLDQSALREIGAYGACWDDEHATYFTRNLVPAVVAAHGWTDEVVAFALSAMFRHDDIAEQLWCKLGMRAALEKTLSPEEFAGQVVSELKANPPEESFRFGHYALLKLWESENQRSAWEERLFAELDRLTPQYDYPNAAWNRAQ